MTALRRLAVTAILLLAATTVAVVLTALTLGRTTPDPAAVIIVLAGGMERGTISAETRGRVEAGVKLFHANIAPRIHFTGGSNGKDHPAAGLQMRDYAVELGVPSDATSAEDTSRSTLQNAILSRPVLGPLAGQPVILVTDGYHLARAWASFRWAGYDAVGLAAASSFGEPPLAEQFGHVGRETLAWWFNLVRVGAWEIAAALSGPEAVPIDLLR